MLVNNLFLAMVSNDLVILLPLFLTICVNNCKAFLRYLWTLEGKDIYWELGINFSVFMRVPE